MNKLITFSKEQWFMVPENLDGLSAIYERCLALHDDDIMSEADKDNDDEAVYIQRGQSFNTFTLSGPLMASSSWFSRYMGMQSTDRAMKYFESLADEGKPILMKVDGPGGQTELMTEFSDTIAARGDQVTAYTNTMAASAHMLMFSAAQGGHYAHENALMGSMGVRGYYATKKQLKGSLTSKNAKNKNPTKASVQETINQIESIYLQKIADYTSMDVGEVVKGGNNGSLFSGAHAHDVGFVDALADTKTVNGSIMSTNKSGADGNNSASGGDDNTNAVAEAIAKNNERWAMVNKHENVVGNAENHLLASTLAESAMSTDELKAALDQLPKSKASVHGSDDDNDDTADGNNQTTNTVAKTEDIEKSASEIAAKAVQAIMAKQGINLPGSEDDDDDEQDEVDKNSPEALAAADLKRWGASSNE